MSLNFNIKLSKSFLMKVHAHPKLAELEGSSFDDPFYQSMWNNHPNELDFAFGGWNGNQFNSTEDVTGFISAFKNLLTKHQIDRAHEAPLLYISAFQYIDSEKQSVKNNNINYYNETGLFLLNLYIKGCEHWEKMKKEPGYFEVYDPSANDYFFTKLDPNESDDIDDLYGADAVLYVTYRIGKSLIKMPQSFLCSLVISSDKTGANQIDIPKTLNIGLLDPAIKRLIREHEDEKTEFMDIFNEESHNLKQLKTISKQKRRTTSEDLTIIKIGGVIQDYLHSFYPMMLKSTLADFLWEYFALLKAYKSKGKEQLPEDYSKLTRFYISQKITKDYIRLKFKNISITGYF